jgi:NADH-quinone oxidoreductase subunit B
MDSAVAVPLAVFRIAACPDVRIVVANAGLACCTMEVEAAIRTGLLVAETKNADPAGQTVLLVSGTVTDALAPAILQMHADLDAQVRVVAFGACASTGGPYWDAPTVTKGIDQLVEVSAYIPGCPPRPDALVAGLLALARREPA